MQPYDFKWTKFYESNIDFHYTGLFHVNSENELIICSTVIDNDNYSILTTRQLITRQEGHLSVGEIHGATDNLYGDFKGYEDEAITFGHVKLRNGEDLKYFIEIGKASMVMIHGVRTLLMVTQTEN